MFQLSLRWLLVLVALVALAIVSFRLASPGWVTAVLTITLMAFWAALVVAMVDRGERQAFAMGFALTVALYGVALMSVPRESGWLQHPDANPETGWLPTTRLLAPLFRATAQITWYDMRSGKAVPDFNPDEPYNGPGRQFISLNETPDRGSFMAVGHCWWAILLGLCGGWFARFVYLRRAGARS